jgi:hypothetical protein
MSDLMSQATRARFGAAIIALAPTVMLAGLFAHPYIATLPDEAAQAALASWFIPIMVMGAITFAVGVFAFAKGIANSGVMSRRLTWVVVGALVVLAISRVVPVGAAQFYVQGAAGVVALWPLAYEMWKRPEAARPAGQPRSMPAA